MNSLGQWLSNNYKIDNINFDDNIKYIFSDSSNHFINSDYIDYDIENNTKTPVVIFSHNRSKSLGKLLNNIKSIDSDRLIYISEDSDNKDIKQL
jgi:hypothetical protein